MSNGRFANLEFDEKKPGQPSGSEKARGQGASDGRGRHFVAEVRGAQYHLGKAEEHELAGDHEEALRSFSAALNENPLLLDAWVGQLVMLLALGEYPEARMWADKALEKFPDNPQVLAAKAVALYRVGLRREARALCDAALEAKGESALVWLCRGELMLEDNRAAAEDCIRHAQRLSPPASPISLRIGALYSRHRKYSRALSILQDATMQLPRSAWAWYLLGSAQEKLGFARQAQMAYERAKELAPHRDLYRRAAKGTHRTLLGKLTGLFRRWFRK